jgi:hypothetical protein
MNTLQKLLSQMRQYVHKDDTGHECRVSSHTVTAWANTIERELANYNRPIVDRETILRPSDSVVAMFQKRAATSSDTSEVKPCS